VRYGGGEGTIRVLRKRERTFNSSFADSGDTSTTDSTSTSDVSEDPTKEERSTSTRRKRAILYQRLKVSVLNKFKIAIAFVQIISSMPWVLNQIRYPKVFDSVATAFSFVDLHFLRLLALECVFKNWNFYRVFIVATALPVGLSFLILLVTVLRLRKVYHEELLRDINDRLMGRSWFLSSSVKDDDVEADDSDDKGPGQDGDEDNDAGEKSPEETAFERRRASHFAEREIRREERRRRRRKIRNQGIFLWLLLTFLIFPSVSTTVFQFFSCENFRDNEEDDDASGDDKDTAFVLQADYSISCNSPSYRAMRVYALCCLALFPFGIPLTYFVLLFGKRKGINPDINDATVLEQIKLPEEDKSFLITAGRELGFVRQLVKVHKRDNDPSVSHLSFLFEEYEPRAYLFSVVDCLRKLILSGVIVFLYPGSYTQIGFATLFALVFAKVYSHARPYLEDEDDLIAEISMEALVLFFFLSLMLHVSNECDNSENETNAATKAFAGKVFGAVFITMIVAIIGLSISVILIEIFGWESLQGLLTRVFTRSRQKRDVIRALSQNIVPPDHPIAASPRSPRRSSDSKGDDDSDVDVDDGAADDDGDDDNTVENGQHEVSVASHDELIYPGSPSPNATARSMSSTNVRLVQGNFVPKEDLPTPPPAGGRSSDPSS